MIGLSGEEILIDCRVDSIDNYTVVWRFSSLHDVLNDKPRELIVDRENGGDPINAHKDGEDYGQVLTVGTVRLTSDPRIDVLHTIGTFMAQPTDSV